MEKSYFRSTRALCFLNIYIRLPIKLYVTEASSYAVGLQSFGKVPFSTFAWVFAPKMLEIGLPCLRMTRSCLQDLCRAVSSFFRGPVAGCRPRHFFDPNGSNAITISDLIDFFFFLLVRSGIVAQLDRKSADGDFLQQGPWRSGEQLWIDLGENSSHSEARKTNCEQFRGKSSCEHTER